MLIERFERRRCEISGLAIEVGTSRYRKDEELIAPASRALCAVAGIQLVRVSVIAISNPVSDSGATTDRGEVAALLRG